MLPEEVGVVIPVGPGRRRNTEIALRYISRLDPAPRAVVLVFDGPEARDEHVGVGQGLPLSLGLTTLPRRHEPGMEQPRNVGVRTLLSNWPECKWVWFLDTDILIGPDCLGRIIEARNLVAHVEPVIVCPYEWMPMGATQPMPQLFNDPRWEMFQQSVGKVYTEDLSAGLACFSGNLVWPIAAFQHVGGYWSEIHHGRCEDGELGLRAVAMGVPITLAPLARGWHMGHDVNMNRTRELNARDVPMLNARHPWVQAGQMVVVEEDGRRFDILCRGCSQSINTGEWWSHATECLAGDLSLPV